MEDYYTYKHVLIYVRDEILPESYAEFNQSRQRILLCNAIRHKRCTYIFGKDLPEKALSYFYEQKPNKHTGMNASFALHKEWSGHFIWWNISITVEKTFNEILKEKRKFLTHIIDKL